MDTIPSLLQSDVKSLRYRPADPPVMGGFYAYRQYANGEFNRIAAAIDVVVDAMEQLQEDMTPAAYGQLAGNGVMAIGSGWTPFPANTAQAPARRMTAAAGWIRPDTAGEFLLQLTAVLEHDTHATKRSFTVHMENDQSGLNGPAFPMAIDADARISVVAIATIITLPDVNPRFRMVAGNAGEPIGAEALTCHFSLYQLGVHS